MVSWAANANGKRYMERYPMGERKPFTCYWWEDPIKGEAKRYDFTLNISEISTDDRLSDNQKELLKSIVGLAYEKYIEFIDEHPTWSSKTA